VVSGEFLFLSLLLGGDSSVSADKPSDGDHAIMRRVIANA
jgi:hypothetical protein